MKKKHKLYLICIILLIISYVFVVWYGNETEERIEESIEEYIKQNKTEQIDPHSEE